jgi:hypothetical protein
VCMRVCMSDVYIEEKKTFEGVGLVWEHFLIGRIYLKTFPQAPHQSWINDRKLELLNPQIYHPRTFNKHSPIHVGMCCNQLSVVIASD